MKIAALLLLLSVSGAASAAPVHIALKPAAVVQPSAEGFVLLGAVADLSGGDASQRIRLSAVPVARSPLSGETRRLTRGDVMLKLRQAGRDPEKEAVLEGASSTEVRSEVRSEAAPDQPLPSRSLTLDAAPAAPAVLCIHRNDPVTIVIQSDTLTITATGIARQDGGTGDRIRVHRDGVMTDLTATVQDEKTVLLEP